MFVLRLVVSRVLLSLLTLLLVSIIIFAMLEVLPGDVASRILGRDATPSPACGRNCTSTRRRNAISTGSAASCAATSARR